MGEHHAGIQAVDCASLEPVPAHRDPRAHLVCVIASPLVALGEPLVGHERDELDDRELIVVNVGRAEGVHIYYSDLRGQIGCESDSAAEGGAQPLAIVRARQRETLVEAHTSLQRALTVAPDLAAEDVKLALTALGRILGRFDVEAVLDRIFSAFCCSALCAALPAWICATRAGSKAPKRSDEIMLKPLSTQASTNQKT